MPQPPSAHMLRNIEIKARCECRSYIKVRVLGPDEPSACWSVGSVVSVRGTGLRIAQDLQATKSAVSRSMPRLI
jgi:hypothetical protein